MTILVRSGVVAASRRYALELVRPSSVAKTGASSTADIVGLGSVDFGLCETLSLNGVFSAEYDNYMIVARNTSNTDAGNALRLRNAGTDATGSNYVRQYLLASSTTIDGGRQTAQTAAWFMVSASTQRSGAVMYIYGPALAQPTAMRDVNVSGISSAYIQDQASTHSLSTAYDGFTVISNGTITGNIAVYGLRG